MTDDTTDQPRRVPWVSDDQAPVYQLPRRRPPAQTLTAAPGR